MTVAEARTVVARAVIEAADGDLISPVWSRQYLAAMEVFYVNGLGQEGSTATRRVTSIHSVSERLRLLPDEGQAGK